MPGSRESKSVRRVVTGHDRAGRAIIQSDGRFAEGLAPKGSP
jgi:hypothetical protein